jgi:enoyl-CoA hydratase/carnithine racemase
MIETADILFTEIKGKGGEVGKITLNRPKVLNALTKQMCILIEAQLKVWANDNKIKAVVIEGLGDRAFCAGGDIRQFYETGPSRVPESRDFFWHEYRMNYRIFNFPKPYISLLHGITMGGGLGVSVHGSHRIAAENLNLAMPETGIGFYPDIGGSYFLPRCLDMTGFYLGLTGERISITDAHYVGLIDAIVPKQRFNELVDAIVITEFSSDPRASVTRIVNQFSTAMEPSRLTAHRVEIDHCFSKASIEEIIRALRKEKISWAQETVSTLETKSPTSLKVTLRQLRKGATLDFADCMKMEFRLTNHFLLHHDFYEGVRAAVIDKDRSPKWQPATLAEVGETDVDAYFATLPGGELNFV